MDDQLLQSTVVQLLDALIANDERAGDTAIASLGPTLQSAVREGPSSFAMQVLMPWEQIIEASVRSAYPDLEADRRRRLSFLYLHANFVEQHLERLFERFEGAFACADKTQWVLQRYRASLVEGVQPPWPPEDRKYWHPKTQSLGFWLGVCLHLEHLYHGRPDLFLADLSVLVQEVGSSQ